MTDKADFVAADRDAYRAAMSRVGHAVYLLTTDGPAGRGGLTISAVTSVTDQPPTVLACINHNASSHDIVRANGVFALSVLTAGFEEVADVFAGRTNLKGPDRFTIGAWDSSPLGLPVLRGSRCWFDCTVIQATDVETHTVFFGHVLSTAVGRMAPSLIYIDRGYRGL